MPTFRPTSASRIGDRNPDLRRWCSSGLTGGWPVFLIDRSRTVNGPAARSDGGILLTMVMVDLISEGLESGESAFIKGLDRLLMLVLLIWMITYASIRLAALLRPLETGHLELASQASVLTRMSEGVVVLRIADSRIVLTNPQFDEM